ncbi:MAG: hypothetical protein PF590_09645 [Candidatus Delongbacteria bacterium]|jgi:hypothetical protein|nr:hypothetical protein [Candidatus Delongbacteria bacterium]
MDEIRILGIYVMDRIKEAGKTQQVLSRYSDIINTRLGFHEVTEQTCSRFGMIVLELEGDKSSRDEIESALNDIEGIRVKHMKFTI